jgi:hypothetical protein
MLSALVYIHTIHEPSWQSTVLSRAHSGTCTCATAKEKVVAADAGERKESGYHGMERVDYLASLITARRAVD